MEEFTAAHLATAILVPAAIWLALELKKARQELDDARREQIKDAKEAMATYARIMADEKEKLPARRGYARLHDSSMDQ